MGTWRTSDIYVTYVFYYWELIFYFYLHVLSCGFGTGLEATITITFRTESLFFSINKEIVVDILQRLFYTFLFRPFFLIYWTLLSYFCSSRKNSQFLFSSSIVYSLFFLFLAWQWKMFCLLLNLNIKCCNLSEIT